MILFVFLGEIFLLSPFFIYFVLQKKKIPTCSLSCDETSRFVFKSFIFWENKLSKYKLVFWAISFGICLLKLISILRLCSSSFFPLLRWVFFYLSFSVNSTKNVFSNRKKKLRKFFFFSLISKLTNRKRSNE
jgi:hypothetical protein